MAESINTYKPLTQAFYNKIFLVLRLASDSECIQWNKSNNGVLIADSNILQKLLWEKLQIHLYTFRKMLMHYGFTRTLEPEGQSYAHMYISNGKYRIPTLQNDPHSLQARKKAKQRQQISIEQKLQKQEIVAKHLNIIGKGLKDSSYKIDSLTSTLKQRCSANDQIIDTIMFKLMTGSVKTPNDKTQLSRQLKMMKDYLNKNESQLKYSLELLQKNIKEQEDICEVLKQDVKRTTEEHQPSSVMHYLTEPQIKSQPI